MNEISEETARSEYTRGPDQADVDALRSLLDLMENFGSNDQRARYLLSSNWMRERGGVARRAAQDRLEVAALRPTRARCPKCGAGSGLDLAVECCACVVEGWEDKR